jgi:chromate transporter
MVAVTLSLGITVLTTWATWAIAVVAAVLALRFRVNAAWLVIGGAVAGWLLS